MNRLLSSKSIKLKVERDNVINSATRDPSQIFAALKQSGGDGWTAEDATKVLYKLATAPVAAGQKIAIIQDQNFCILISILEKRLGDINHADCGFIFWSLAKLDWKDPGLYEKLAAKFTKKVSSCFTGRDISNVVWAIGRSGWFNNEFLTALLDACLYRPSQFNEQDIANIVWGLARIDCYDRKLLEKLSSKAQKRILKFRPSELVSLAWAYSTLRHDDPCLMAAICGVLRGKANELSPQERCNMAWALAVIGHLHKPLMTAISTITILRVKALSATEIATMLWSAAVLNFEDMVLLNALADAAKAKSHEFLPPHWAQLYQAYMVFPNMAIAPEVLEKAKSVWIKETHDYRRAPKNQDDIADSIEALGVACELDYFTEDKELCIDIAVPDQNVAIDIGNPLHFASNTARPLAQTACRHKLLERHGWRVVSLPPFLWTSMNKKEQEKFLMNALQLRMGSSEASMSMTDLTARGYSDEMSSSRSSHSQSMRYSADYFQQPLNSARSGDSW